MRFSEVTVSKSLKRNLGNYEAVDAFVSAKVTLESQDDDLELAIGVAFAELDRSLAQQDPGNMLDRAEPQRRRAPAHRDWCPRKAAPVPVCPCQGAPSLVEPAAAPASPGPAAPLASSAPALPSLAPQAPAASSGPPSAPAMPPLAPVPAAPGSATALASRAAATLARAGVHLDGDAVGPDFYADVSKSLPLTEETQPAGTPEPGQASGLRSKTSAAGSSPAPAMAPAPPNAAPSAPSPHPPKLAAPEPQVLLIVTEHVQPAGAPYLEGLGIRFAPVKPGYEPRWHAVLASAEAHRVSKVLAQRKVKYRLDVV